MESPCFFSCIFWTKSPYEIHLSEANLFQHHDCIDRIVYDSSRPILVSAGGAGESDRLYEWMDFDESLLRSVFFLCLYEGVSKKRITSFW